MPTQLWAHIKSGERIVVVTDSDGTVVQAVGPLHYSDILPVIRDGFDSDADLVEDLQTTADQYRLCEDQLGD